VVGRGVIAPVRLNEPLLDSKLGDRAGGAGLPIVIPEGMRAVSVSVSDVVTVSGFVTPGTRADLMLTMVNPATSEQTTKTILQNVTALAADKVVTQDPAGKPLTYGVLTVLLTPEDAEKLVLASSTGSIQLALRNRVDVKEFQSDGARADRLFAGSGGGPRATGTRPRAVVPAPQAEERNGRAGMIEVYKGGVKTLIQF
jgi:pilus assembly protein CpaB